jgi:hypothetical protein
MDSSRPGKKSRLIIAVFACLFWTAAVPAQSTAIGLTPASLESVVRPGATYSQSFTINNSTATAMRFHCSAADMGYNADEKRVEGKAGTMSRSASLWIQFTPADVMVPANGSAVAKAVITIPAAAAGSYYTVPIFEGRPEMPQPTSGSSVASFGIRFKGIIVLTTDRGSEYNLEIKSAVVEPPSATAPLALKIDIKNRGTAFTRVRGSYAILDSEGKLMGRGTISSRKMFPIQHEALRSEWSGKLPPGKYSATVLLSYDRVGSESASIVREIPFTVQ